MRDHVHQPIIGLVYLRQQVQHPVPVSFSLHGPSKWQSCLGPSRGNGHPSLLSSQVLVMTRLWGNGASSAMGDFPARGTPLRGLCAIAISGLKLG